MFRIAVTLAVLTIAMPAIAQDRYRPVKKLGVHRTTPNQQEKDAIAAEERNARTDAARNAAKDRYQQQKDNIKRMMDNYQFSRCPGCR